MIASYPPATPVTGISLGDIVWDHFEHFPVYKKEMARLKIPFYPVIGNHDHDKEIFVGQKLLPTPTKNISVRLIMLFS